MNETMKTFGYPESLIREYDDWVVLLRPRQVTLGSLVLVSKERATAFSELGPASFSELHRIVCDIETTLGTHFRYDKINYLMLMMVDPDVHFHVIPRYGDPRQWGGVDFMDYGWPGPPALGRVNELGEEDRERLTAHLKKGWCR